MVLNWVFCVQESLNALELWMISKDTGIGNWIVDEVLFQAKILPERMASQLTDNEIFEIHNAIQYVINVSIDSQASYDDFPKDFLIHARGWGSKGLQDERVGICPECGEKISVAKVGGRTTYFCGNRQGM